MASALPLWVRDICGVGGIGSLAQPGAVFLPLLPIAVAAVMLVLVSSRRPVVS